MSRGTARLPAVSALRFAGHAAPGLLGAYLVLTVFAGLLPVVATWLTKLVFDELVRPDASSSRLTLLAALLAGAGLLAVLLANVSAYLIAQARRVVALRAQDRLYESVNGLAGLARFEDPAFLDHLQMARFAGEMAPVQVADGVVGVVKSMVTTVGLAVSVLAVSPGFAGALVASAVPAVAAEVALARRRAATSFQLSPAQRREAMYGGLLSSAQAAKEIRLFGIGDLLRGRMYAERQTANLANRRLDRSRMGIQSLLGLMAAAISGAGLVWAASHALAGSLSVGTVSMFVAAIAGVHGGLSGTATTVALAHQQAEEFRHFLYVADVEPDLPVAAEPAPSTRLRDGIELRDVWFRYSDRHPWILRGVDLFIPQGQAFALVGKNGAGKSTLVKLMCRLYDPTRGVILWDGVDIRDVAVADLRARIRAVFQDYVEYEMTAADNIGLGDVDRRTDLGAIEAAAGKAEIHRDLSALPRGFDTMLSRHFLSAGAAAEDDTGVRLSGGQWQRVALARAYMRTDPDLLILDEPSSGLDAEAEHEVHTTMRALRQGRTSLLISHRLAAARDADRIVVLEDGVIMESGTHEELMRSGGRYAGLFALQARDYQLGDHIGSLPVR